MKIGILQCDDVLEKYQPEYGNYPAMFQDLLRASEPQLTFAVYRVMDGELPESTSECDTWLMTGSRYSAYDSQEWIANLKCFVRDLYKDRSILVGVCFGHQIIAEALGGQADLSEKGWGIGLSRNQINKRRSWMEPYLPRKTSGSQELALLVSHQDQIVALPSKGEVLASSELCENFMVQYGSHFLSIQGHPEFSPEYTLELIQGRSDRIPGERLQQGVDSLKGARQGHDGLLVGRWILNFMQGSLQSIENE